MCLNPIKIRNKGYYRLGGMPFVEVPCGKCEECRSTKQIDYFVRAWSIFRSLPASWSCWFSTFTFNDDNIPKSRVMAVENAETKCIGETICFDHRLLHRFCKSYRQFYRRDLRLPPPQMLFTCEYGETTLRPHYHAIIFLPRVMAWQSFRDEIARFWHYGFTKNVAITLSDGMVRERTPENSFKYVVKYASKGSAILPYYLNHGDNVFLGDIEPKNYKPRVFTTQHFGAPLEGVLRPLNYEDNKILFDVLGKWKSFNLPAYYRRRYYVDNKVIKREPYIKKTFWNPAQKCYRTLTETSYKNGYDLVRYNALSKRFRIEFDKVLPKSFITQQDFVDYRLLDYNANKERRYIFKSLPLNYDPFNSDGITLDMLFGDHPLQFFRQFTNVNFDPANCEKVSANGVLFARHSSFYNDMVSKYGDSYSRELARIESCIEQMRLDDIAKRKRTFKGQFVADMEYYRLHNISKLE